MPSYRGRKLLRALDIYEKSGFDGVELDCTGFNFSSNKFYTMCTEYNAYIKSLIAPCLTLKNPLYCALYGDVTLRSLYETLKPNNIIFRVPGSPGLKKIFNYIFKDRIAYFKNKYGNAPILIENMPPSILSYMTPIMGIKTIRDFAYQHDIYINFDISNCAESGKDILLSYDMLAPRVKSVHLGDYGGIKGYSHLIPGSGLLPIGMLLSKMKNNKFNGNISIEISPKVTDKLDEDEMIRLYKELIGFVKSYF
jgi:hypothetical protein